jgi:uncharacterized protein (DUF58 family)
MTSTEALKQIRRIQLVSTRMATSIFAGEYQSVFKGKGIEFEELREYQPGDDIRTIDWNVTARSSRPFVRQFVEERELTVMIMLDISPSLSFGTHHGLKSRTAAEVSALLAGAALRNNDKVGLILFTDRIERYIPPRKGNRHLFKMIREALFLQPAGTGTDIAGALEYLNRIMKRSAVVFLISDCYAPEFTTPLMMAQARHDLVAVAITDPAEIDLPEVGLIKLDDAETGKSTLVDTSDPEVRRQYHRNGVMLREERRRLFRSAGTDYVEITPEASYLQTLVGFFRRRGRRLRR